MPPIGRSGRTLRCCLCSALLLTGAGLSASLAPAAALAESLAPVGLAASAQPLAGGQSATAPYEACPAPGPGRAACQSVVVPPVAKIASPAFGVAPASAGVNGSGLTPAELQSAYKLPSWTQGSGQTVAVVDAYDDPTAESDLATYRSAYGLPPCTSASGCFKKVNETGGTSYPPSPTSEQGDWDLEESLDLDMVSAVCPSCHILLVEASSAGFPDLTAAENEAATLGATEISNSWASPEFAEETSFDEAFKHAGIPITAASGDWGYDNHELGASAPSYPAASPNVIAVGGTVLTQGEGARGWTEVVWPHSGSGCSLYEPKPAYQADGGCAGRTTNDVAAVAEGLSVYDTTHAVGTQRLPDWITVGGTSAAAPIVAAVEALSEAGVRSSGAAALYERPASLFDVITGANGSCGGYLCTAGNGYSGPSGNGTPDGGAPPAAEVQVARSGTGAGSVGSSPAGIECGASCRASFAGGTRVTLSATPATGSTFSEWRGACAGSGPCTLSASRTMALTAVFRASGTPPGWSAQTLAPPSGREPLAPGSSTQESFFNVSLSASGDVRAKVIYNHPTGTCSFATSDTGGVFLERDGESGWVSEGELTAPAVGSDSAARWANCAAFGSVTQLSRDGSTLLVAPETASVYTPELGARYRCAAFVYHHGAGGWALQGTLMPPGVEAGGSAQAERCAHYGIDGALSDDGSHVAIAAQGHVDLYAREASSKWGLQQQVALPGGPGCLETTTPGGLALAGNAARLLVSQPDCNAGGDLLSGRVYAYTRAGSSWSLSQTIESPEPHVENEFGKSVAISDDGATAAIGIGRAGTGLPAWAGAAWVYEREASGWHARERLAPSSPAEDGRFACPAIVGSGARILCEAADAVGFNAEQGSLYSFERPRAGWASGESAPQRVFAGEGSAHDSLGEGGALRALGLAVSADGSVLDATISPANLANGTYAESTIGDEFTAPPVHSPPTIESFSPASGSSGATVTIAGTNLSGASAVVFAGTEASAYVVESPTQITATVPAGASSGPISVTTPGGTTVSAQSFTVLKPRIAPQALAVSPDEGSTLGGVSVTITGSGFVAGATVAIGGAPATSVRVASETEITALTPARPRGQYTVVVTDSRGTTGGGPTYTYVAPPPPAVSSITPAEGSTLGGTTVTIHGSGFVSGATVTIGGVKAGSLTVRSETEITGHTAAAPAGLDEVLVSDSRGVSSGGPEFTYFALPPPTVYAITPAEGLTVGGTAITVTGSGFLPGATVTIGHMRATAVSVRSETEITALTPAETRGEAEVLVSDSRGSSSGGPDYTFVAPPPPAVTAISPAQGPTSGGTRVTIRGSGFVAGASVTIGGRASSVSVRSETELTAWTPAGRAGQHEVVVSDRRGTSRGAPQYTYVAMPAAAAKASLRLGCAGATTCSGTVTLTAPAGTKATASGGPAHRPRVRALAAGTFSVSAGGSSTIQIALDGAGRAMLRTGHGHLDATLTIRGAQAQAQPERSQSFPVRVEGPPRGSRVARAGRHRGEITVHV